MQTFIVPIGVNEITVELHGAGGGKGYFDGANYANGGKGALVIAKCGVSSGQSFQVYVGGVGGDATSTAGGSAGYNGGGAGQYSSSYTTGEGGQYVTSYTGAGGGDKYYTE